VPSVPTIPTVPSAPSVRSGPDALNSAKDDLPGEMMVPPPVTSRKKVTVHRTANEIAEFLQSLEAESATYKQICMHFTPKAASQDIRKEVESHTTRFSVVGDLVTLRDPLRREALTCFIKELVRQPLQRQEIKPEEACEAIWCAAAYAMKATPTEVAKVLLTVSKATLKKKMKVPKGFYPVNMPLVLACIIDRIMITEKQQGGSRFEKTFSQHLLKILFSRWTLGSVHGSQFLANLSLTWDSLGWFQEKHLEPCKKALMLLVAYAGKEGVPDPPDKNDGHGRYRVVARDTDEAAGSEPLCSEVVLQELRTLSEPDEKTPTATEVRRDRVNHAMAQMGLGTESTQHSSLAAKSSKPPEDHPAEVPTASEPTNSEAALFGSPVKGPSAEPQPETLNDKELEELFEPSEAGDAPEDPANDIGDEEQETIPTASVPSSTWIQNLPTILLLQRCPRPASAKLASSDLPPRPPRTQHFSKNRPRRPWHTTHLPARQRSRTNRRQASKPHRHTRMNLRANAHEWTQLLKALPKA